MDLVPSCFLEVFMNSLDVASKEKNLTECEYALIELEEHLDHYGIIWVADEQNIQNEIFKMVHNSEELKETSKN